MTLIRKRMRKTQHHHQHQSRHDVLLQVLGGKEQLGLVQTLVQTIKDMKLQALMKGSLDGGTRTKQTAEQNDESSYPMMMMKIKMNAQGAIPQPARALFFNTAIVGCFESASVSLIPTLDWESMIREAQENINAYKEWEQEL
jgi:hypothetical protein